MSLSEKIKKIASNEKKMFEFVRIMLMVDKFPCDCSPGSCDYSKLLEPLKMFFEQNITVDEKKIFFVDYCLKHEDVFELLKDFMYFYVIL